MPTLPTSFDDGRRGRTARRRRNCVLPGGLDFRRPIPDRLRACSQTSGSPSVRLKPKGEGVSVVTKPRVLIVYYTVTKQSEKVTAEIAKELEARGCEATRALIEFTDERWVPHLSQFPMKRPMAQLATILPAQMRHKTGEISIPAEAQAGDYGFVLI